MSIPYECMVIITKLIVLRTVKLNTEISPAKITDLHLYSKGHPVIKFIDANARNGKKILVEVSQLT